MGLSIDEHIAQLKKLKSFHNGSYGASINFAIATMRKYQKIENIIKNAGVFTFNVPEIRRIAEVMDIDTLLEVADKYQKIEQILSDWINDDSVGMSDYWMGRIKEVIEDGKCD